MLSSFLSFCFLFYLGHLLHLLRVFHSIYRRLPGALICRILFFTALRSHLYSLSLCLSRRLATLMALLSQFPGFIHGYGIPNG